MRLLVVDKRYLISQILQPAVCMPCRFCSEFHMRAMLFVFFPIADSASANLAQHGRLAGTDSNGYTDDAHFSVLASVS